MVEIYAILIEKGIKKIEDVPIEIKHQVEKRLEQ